jgi:hypothetical protein
VVLVAAPALKLTGTLTTFTRLSDSGKPVHHRFCPECGCGIADEADAAPGFLMVHVGTLDDRSWVKPQMEIYCDSAQPWARLGEDLQHFAKMPPA